jgi:hypothetical protein
VFNLFVIIDDILDFSHDFAESPLGESCCDFQILQLRNCFHLVHLVREILQIYRFCPLNIKCVEGCARQISVWLVFGPRGYSLQLLTRNFREDFVYYTLDWVSLCVPLNNCGNQVLVNAWGFHLAE